MLESKTPFKVKITTENSNTVIANAGLEKVENKGLYREHTFAATKPIPTYLLALAVGPFDVVEGPKIPANKIRQRPLKLRGIALKGKGEDYKFALRETPKIIEKLEEYFAYEYPYDKLDVIAVPDFRAGAMENVGAITFREWYLLMDEKTAAADQTRLFYLVMAHELAHMWFGNLVTMAWWDDLWLNEAFATWSSYKIIDQLKPEYASVIRLMEDGFSAMDVDSLVSSRKIREPIVESHDIHNAFDDITYSKGGAFLSMIESYLGEDKFRDAVRSHMRKYAFGHATSKDFLHSLAKLSDESLVKSADTFLNQSGVPNVDLSYKCADGGVKISVEQSRYAPLGSKVDKERVWRIPMCIGYESNGSVKKHCFTLDNKTKSLDIQQASCPKFVMPNFNGRGYYRFSLNPSNWQPLLSSKKGMLSEKDRLALADSLLAGLSSGSLEYELVFSALKDLASADSRALSGYFMTFVKETYDHWLSKEDRQSVVNVSRDTIKSIYSELAKKAYLKPEQRSLKRDAANFLAFIADDAQVRQELAVIGRGYLGGLLSGKSVANVDENLLPDAMAVALQGESDAFLSQTITLFKKNDDPAERRNLLMAIAKSRKNQNAQAVRMLALDDDIKKNEKLQILNRHLNDPGNQPEVFNFLKSNFGGFVEKLSESQRGNLPYLATGLCTTDAAREVQAFFRNSIGKFEGGPRNLAETVEKIEICAAKKAHIGGKAQEFLANMKSRPVAAN